MKKYLLLLFIVFTQAFLSAQEIPNPGFENWTDGNPDGWSTSNIPGFAVTVTQSSASHSGSSAAKLEIIDFGGSPFYALMTTNVFIVTQKYGSLLGFYQFHPVSSGAVFAISILLLKDGNFIGAGSFETENAAQSYIQFTAPIDYSTADVPDSAYITVFVADDNDSTSGVGTFALLDDLSFGGVVGIDEISNNIPDQFEMKQNYPNPFNPSTAIEYSVPIESNVELKVFDIIGNEVAILVNEYHRPGTFKVNFDGTGLSSGVYIARMNAGSFIKSFKMTLMK